MYHDGPGGDVRRREFAASCRAGHHVGVVEVVGVVRGGEMEKKIDGWRTVFVVLVGVNELAGDRRSMAIRGSACQPPRKSGAAGLMTPLVTNCAMHYHGWAAVTTEHGLAVWHSIRVCKGEVRWGAEEKG